MKRGSIITFEEKPLQQLTFNPKNCFSGIEAAQTVLDQINVKF